MRIASLFVIFAGFMPVPLVGQEDRPTAERLWIRLTTRGGDSASEWIVGRLDLLTPDQILLQTIGTPPLWISDKSIVRIERHDGWQQRPVLRNGLLGALIGLTVGLVLDQAVGCGMPCYGSIPVGTGVGLWIAAKRTTWRWTPVTFTTLDSERERAVGGSRIGVLLAAPR